MSIITPHELIHEEGKLSGHYWPAIDGFIFKPVPQEGEVAPELKPNVKFAAQLRVGDNSYGVVAHLRDHGKHYHFRRCPYEPKAIPVPTA